MALAAADMNSDVSNHTRLQCKGADEGLTIAEVSRQYDISADTLRYYERIGLLPHVGRTSGGIRNYSEDDCHWVEYICGPNQ